MVLGPEFGAMAALRLAIVGRRPRLLALASRTLIAGFVIANTAVTVLSMIGRAIGLIDPAAISGSRADTAFIYQPRVWSVIVAVIAAAAGVLSLTSSKVGGLSGVFIFVTTVPAAGNIALGIAVGDWAEVRGSALQLVINLVAYHLPEAPDVRSSARGINRWRRRAGWTHRPARRRSAARRATSGTARP